MEPFYKCLNLTDLLRIVKSSGDFIIIDDIKKDISESILGLYKEHGIVQITKIKNEKDKRLIMYRTFCIEYPKLSIIISDKSKCSFDDYIEEEYKKYQNRKYTFDVLEDILQARYNIYNRVIFHNRISIMKQLYDFYNRFIISEIDYDDYLEFIYYMTTHLGEHNHLIPLSKFKELPH